MGGISSLLERGGVWGNAKHTPPTPTPPPVHGLGTVVLDAHLLDQLLELVGLGLEVDGTRADDLVSHAVDRAY